MKTMILILMTLTLGACVYAESPDGRFAMLDLPVQSQTTVHKTVTVNAPPGTIVNISDMPPPIVYDRRHSHRLHCYDETEHGTRVRRRLCY